MGMLEEKTRSSKSHQSGLDRKGIKLKEVNIVAPELILLAKPRA
jgi:hypothetical protein